MRPVRPRRLAGQLWQGGSTYPGGVHSNDPVRAYVYTAGATYVGWSQAFSHEVLEMLVDPSTGVYYSYAGESAALEDRGSG